MWCRGNRCLSLVTLGEALLSRYGSFLTHLKPPTYNSVRRARCFTPRLIRAAMISKQIFPVPSLPKIAALERELVAVDAALERWRSETRVVQDAIATLNDAEIVAAHAELTGRLDGLEAQLRALPSAPVEPPHVGLTIDTLCSVGQHC